MLRSALRSVFAWLGRHELATLVLLAAIAAAGWAFVEIAAEMTEGDLTAFDRRILLAMRNPDDLSDPVGARWVEELARDATALGGVGVMVFLTASVCLYLVLVRKRRSAAFVAAAIVGGFVVSMLLKSAYDRPRPDLVPHGSHVYTTSFPSGHSMMAAVTYLTLGAMLARVEQRFVLKAYFLLLAVVLTAAVGVSRVYLGVHWPSDVLAGWTAGACWALITWWAARALQRRGKVEDAGRSGEPEAPPPG